jgi:hypothetical protein
MVRAARAISSAQSARFGLVIRPVNTPALFAHGQHDGSDLRDTPIADQDSWHGDG